MADTVNNLIRLIAAGVTTTLAGGGGGTSSGCLDGTGTNALFDYSQGLAFDGQGNIIVVDTNCGRIRKVTLQGLTTTLAGWSSGNFADGLGTSASFALPQGIAIDFLGNVIVGDSSNERIRMVTPGGLVTTLAGSGAYGGSSNGAGSSASFANPLGVAADSAGRIFVADQQDHRICLINLQFACLLQRLRLDLAPPSAHKQRQH